jgi:hypothetical protein
MGGQHAAGYLGPGYGYRDLAVFVKATLEHGLHQAAYYHEDNKQDPNESRGHIFSIICILMTTPQISLLLQK